MNEELIRANTDAKDKKKGERAANPYEKGTRYYELYENNPYTAETFTREKTPWDTFANVWGFRSGYDAAYDEWLKAGREYDAQIAQIKGEDAYNSDAAKAERMKQAGLNPDLLGTEGASEAAEFAQEQTSPDVNKTSEQIEKAAGFIDGIMKAVTFGLSISGQVTSLMGGIADVKGKSYDNTKKIQDLANNFIENWSTEPFEEEFKEINGEYKPTGKMEKMPFNQYAGNMRREAIEWAKENGFNRKDAEKFADAVWNSTHGNKGKLYDKWKNTQKSRSDFITTDQSKYTTREDEDQKILGITGELVTNWDQAIINEAEHRNFKTGNDRDYEELRNGTTQAQAFNKENEAKAGKSEIQSQSRKVVEDTLKKLEPYAKEGKMLAIALMGAIPMLYLKYSGD